MAARHCTNWPFEVSSIYRFKNISTACLNPFSSFNSTVDHAVLRNNGFLKPNPYVEILVDGKAVRKTETLKNTHHPRWDQELTVLVTPVSVLQFRVLDHSSFRKDTVLGEKTVTMPELLKKQRDARTENYILYMHLAKPSHSSGGANGETSPDGRTGNSEMLVVIKGLVRMDAESGGVRTEPNVVNNGSSNCNSGNGNAVSGSSQNGDLVRMRGRVSGDDFEGGAGGSGTSAVAAVGAVKRNSGIVWTTTTPGEANSRAAICGQVSENWIDGLIFG